MMTIVVVGNIHSSIHSPLFHSPISADNTAVESSPAPSDNQSEESSQNQDSDESDQDYMDGVVIGSIAGFSFALVTVCLVGVVVALVVFIDRKYRNTPVLKLEQQNNTGDEEKAKNGLLKQIST